MGKKLWTEREIEILRTLYPHPDYSARDITKLLPDRSRNAIKGKALAMNIPGNTKYGRKWNEQEDDIIRQYYPNLKYSAKDIADMLDNRTAAAVATRAHFLKINGNRKWSEDEDALLKKNYCNPNMPSRDIAKTLPERTTGAIAQRAVLLEITRPHWTDELKAIRDLYRAYRDKGARNRALCFELTLEQFKTLITKPCHYCGSEPIGEYKRHDWELLYFNGIDRIDNNKGYTANNVVPCCKHCNRAKRDRTYEDFRDWISQVYHYWGQADNESDILY